MRNKRFKVRRITARGLIEIKSKKMLPGPVKRLVFKKTDRGRFPIRIRAQVFSGENAGQLIRVADGLLEWIEHGRKPALDMPVASVTWNDLPRLAAVLRQRTFSPTQEIWPEEFSMALDALTPTIESVLAEYCRFRLPQPTQQKVLDLVARTAWAGLSGTRLPSKPDQWRSKFASALAALFDPGDSGADPERDPKTPGDWYAQSAMWLGRVKATCARHDLGFAQSSAVEAYSSWLFAWMDFQVRRPSRLGQDAPMTLREFEDGVFFPALETALSLSFGKAVPPRRRSAVQARPDYGFQRILYHEVRTRFNRLRTHWRRTSRFRGRTILEPLSDDLEVQEGVEILLRELPGMRAKQTESIKTLSALVRIERNLSTGLGRREHRSLAYQRLSKRTGIRIGTLRKRISDAKRLLQKYLIRGRRNARKR